MIAEVVAPSAASLLMVKSIWMPFVMAFFFLGATLMLLPFLHPIAVDHDESARTLLSPRITITSTSSLSNVAVVSQESMRHKFRSICRQRNLLLLLLIFFFGMFRPATLRLLLQFIFVQFGGHSLPPPGCWVQCLISTSFYLSFAFHRGYAGNAKTPKPPRKRSI